MSSDCKCIAGRRGLDLFVWYVYDITDTKIRNRIIAIIQKYGFVRVQKSLFAANVSKNTIDEIMIQSEKAIDEKTDSVYILPMCQSDFGETILLGKAFDKKYVNDEIKVLVI